MFPNIPHHITQRGNRREDVFFKESDRFTYLEWLSNYCKKWRVDVLAYCLMTNHVHLVLQPKTEEGLQRVMKPLHMRYAQHVNKAKGWKGHLWQGRFFSSPLDYAYTWAAIRYVERNPVRAGMIEKAEDFPWSSAAAHCGLTLDPILSPLPEMERPTPESGWSDWLAIPEDEKMTNRLRRNVEKGLPCGSEAFIETLENYQENHSDFVPREGLPLIKGSVPFPPPFPPLLLLTERIFL